MGEVVTVGLDIAKSVFQVHGVDAEGQAVLHRLLTRAKLLPFFESCRAAGWAWRPAPQLITGRAA